MKSVIRLSTLLFTIATIAACTEAAPPPSTSSASEALTAAQCMYFQDGGRTTICHATGSARNPVVQITIATAACVNAHAAHAGDFVAVDGSCGPGACLAEDSPCDATLPCCDGLACGASGRCEAPPVTCVHETFEVDGCASANGRSVLEGTATVSTPTFDDPHTYLPASEDCEYSFGPCSTYNADMDHPVLATGGNGKVVLTFTRPMVSFSLGTLVGYTGVEVTFLRGGVVVASEVLGDDDQAACDQRLSRAWSVPDGFDTVRFDSGGLAYGITDLESCYVDSGSR